MIQYGVMCTRRTEPNDPIKESWCRVILITTWHREMAFTNMDCQLWFPLSVLPCSDPCRAQAGLGERRRMKTTQEKVQVWLDQIDDWQGHLRWRIVCATKWPCTTTRTIFLPLHTFCWCCCCSSSKLCISLARIIQHENFPTSNRFFEMCVCVCMEGGERIGDGNGDGLQLWTSFGVEKLSHSGVQKKKTPSCTPKTPGCCFAGSYSESLERIQYCE